MEVKDIMTRGAVSVSPGESVEVAARTMLRCNVGALPVCNGGRLCGLITDRDIVTRCLAAGKVAGVTTVQQVMTEQVTAVNPNMEVGAAAHLMGRLQVRRLPVVENGVLCGMISLGDLCQHEQSAPDAVDVLTEISSNVVDR